jgi:UDP-GlcNAc:undecaprenyl-phosphate GlcNAc-1-phosphate transferase
MDIVSPRFVVAFGVALAASLALTPAVRWWATRAGFLAVPVSDRWHRRPVALLGGVAIVAAFVIGAAASGAVSQVLPLVLYCGAMFTLGAADDIWHMRPVGKLAGQAAITAVFLWAVPDLQLIGIPALDRPLLFLWLVGIVNAFNLLDNIDGLSAGVAGIAGLCYVVILMAAGQTALALALAAFVGAVCGFLFYNFQPASIFMGDGGAFFLGSFLAAASVLAAPGLHSRLVSVAVVPLLILLIPIFDTTFVTVTRGLAGRSALVGGRDHTSHRLVALGISERRAVLALYVLAAAGGVVAIALQQTGLTYSIALIALYIVMLLAAGVVLGHVDATPNLDAAAGTAAPLVADLTYRYRVYEVLLDAALAAVAYYAAFRIRFEEPLFSGFLPQFFVSLPLVVACQIGGLWLVGKYRQVWRAVGAGELMTIVRGVLAGGAAAIILMLYLYRFVGYSRWVFAIDGVILAFLLVGSRIAITSIDDHLRHQRARGRRVLIYGAGRGGALLLRELLQNHELGLRPVGFVDDQRAKQRVKIDGVPVVGGTADLPALLERLSIEEVLVGVRDLAPAQLARLLDICRPQQVTVRRMRFALEEVDAADRPSLRAINNGS